MNTAYTSYLICPTALPTYVGCHGQGALGGTNHTGMCTYICHASPAVAQTGATIMNYPGAGAQVPFTFNCTAIACYAPAPQAAAVPPRNTLPPACLAGPANTTCCVQSATAVPQCPPITLTQFPVCHTVIGSCPVPNGGAGAEAQTTDATVTVYYCTHQPTMGACTAVGCATIGICPPAPQAAGAQLPTMPTGCLCPTITPPMCPGAGPQVPTPVPTASGGAQAQTGVTMAACLTFMQICPHTMYCQGGGAQAQAGTTISTCHSYVDFCMLTSYCKV